MTNTRHEPLSQYRIVRQLGLGVTQITYTDDQFTADYYAECYNAEIEEWDGEKWVKVLP